MSLQDPEFFPDTLHFSNKSQAYSPIDPRLYINTVREIVVCRQEAQLCSLITECSILRNRLRSSRIWKVPHRLNLVGEHVYSELASPWLLAEAAFGPCPSLRRRRAQRQAKRGCLVSFIRYAYSTYPQSQSLRFTLVAQDDDGCLCPTRGAGNG